MPNIGDLKTKVVNGDILEFDIPAMVVECCCCGLTHVFVLRHIEGRPVLQVFESPYETDDARKKGEV